MARGLLCMLLPALAVGKVSIPTKEIAPGVHMPVLSIGTWTQGTKEDVNAIVKNWLALGARGIDGAWGYFNQANVTQAIADAGVDRKDVFITSKIPSCMGKTLANQFIKNCLKQFNTSYIDLMLIHSDFGVGCAGTWEALEDYTAKGALKAIGVSNWVAKDFESLLKTAKVKPAVNQIEWNLFSHDDETAKYCEEKGITIESYSPFEMSGHFGKNTSIWTDPTVSGIGQTHKVSNAQVALKWIIQRGRVAAFMSSNSAHQANDADLNGFNLTETELTMLDSLQKNSSKIIV